MTKTGAMILLAATATLTLPGCKPGASGGANASNAAVGGDAGMAAQTKLNGYTNVFNKFIGRNSFKDSRDAFDGIFQGQKKSDIPSPHTGELTYTLDILRRTRALPGGAADLDQAADKLASTLGTLVKHLEALDPYYESKAYLEDGSKRGHAEEPVVRAEYAATAAAFETFSSLIDRERRAADTIELAKLKADGRMVAYNSKLMMQQAEGIVKPFGGEADLKNPAKYAQADVQVAALEKTLADQRVAIVAEKTSGKLDENMARSEGNLDEQLTKLIGDYRTLKQSKEQYLYNFMLATYNSAVQISNQNNAPPGVIM